MSQAHVGMVIEMLLTDENLRIRFAFERIETIADLCVRGVELSGRRDRPPLPNGSSSVVPGSRSGTRMAAVDQYSGVRFALSGRRPIRRSWEKPSLRERWTKSITLLARRETRRAQA